VPAGVEGLGPVRRRARDDDRRFADREVADAVQDRDAPDRPSLDELGGDLSEASVGELLPRLVVEGRDLACRRRVADRPDEDACAS
jgi:hypothetical protein